MSLEDWKDVVGNGATVSTIVMFLVGIQVCLGFWRQKTTGESSCLTFLMGVAMTFVWASYGRLVGDSKLEFVNGTGLVLQTIYTFVFYGYASSKIKVISNKIMPKKVVTSNNTHLKSPETIPNIANN